MIKVERTDKGQAKAPNTIPISPAAFHKQEGTDIYWLGGAGALINSRGTLLMIDPVLTGFDLPLLVESPLTPEAVPALDAVLITHSDNDHFSRETCLALQPVTSQYHAPVYVAGLMQDMGLDGIGHPIGKPFAVQDFGQGTRQEDEEGMRQEARQPVQVTLTPADHAWQNALMPDRTRDFQPEDACGFWLETADGIIWAYGDSRLMETHLHMPEPDVIFFDFSNDAWHIGVEGAVRLANAYPSAVLILWHWGSVDAPDMAPFNGDPEVLVGRIAHPERIRMLAPGEAFRMGRRES